MTVSCCCPPAEEEEEMVEKMEMEMEDPTEVFVAATGAPTVSSALSDLKQIAKRPFTKLNKNQ